MSTNIRSSQPLSPIPTEKRNPEVKAVSKLPSGKFNVFLTVTLDQKTPQYYAMKVIPHVDDHPSSMFYNEVKFSTLTHPNIITPSFFEKEKIISTKQSTQKASLIFSEYAPHGDLFNALMMQRVDFDEKLARTYFHQLISGLEYLHANNIAHLDLKLENLVLDSDFKLRIIDFDLSKDSSLFDKEPLLTTKHYRAPEIRNGVCQNGFAADIYSTGIILFLLLSGGTQPYMEDELTNGEDLYEYFANKKEKFWEVHESFSGPGFWDQDTRKFIESLCCFDVKKRATIQSIKSSQWFNGEIYSEKELKRVMAKYFK